MFKTSPSNARGEGSISGQGAGIPHGWRPKNQNIKRKQYFNKFNEDFKKLSSKNLKKKVMSWIFSFLVSEEERPWEGQGGGSVPSLQAVSSSHAAPAGAQHFQRGRVRKGSTIGSWLPSLVLAQVWCVSREGSSDVEMSDRVSANGRWQCHLANIDI